MWMHISSGRGPEECCRAVGLFVNYIAEECRKKNIKVHILDKVSSRYSGNYQSLMLSLEAKEAFLLGKNFEGSLLWICKSPYRVNCERRNWFFNAEIYREPDQATLDLAQIKVETMRSSGNGGQNVNKVESAVRLTHLPTNISVVAREERSQAFNKKTGPSPVE